MEHLLGCGGADAFRMMLPATLRAGVTPVEARETVYQATLLAAQANRVMTDIYEAHKDDRTPLEEYAESLEDGDSFEEAQAGDPEEEAEDE